ncbi:putative RNA methyltransferase [Dechloromonas sp.]|uniref:putative RNA methyltransferase n=1 Tax=Dechloromonas sp. TaxID=1917218 RepID=UPI00121800D2|nr:methyltransferase domain-containing protein [Dechloromonas sp.]MBU3698224.1 methyltransferase domain-containing protein [Dechloromonas sp.]TEX49729.1 MAG: rRNA (guanine-N1)-methyltransferase [Rhodocyclaceae bacterium]
MTLEAFPFLSCPLDAQSLQPSESGWRCPSGHCFDVAREGYLNLLPVQQKRSRDPGDSKAMVAARRRYLASGIYAPIAAMVARHALLADTDQKPLAILDAGCGEGYYLQQLIAAAGSRLLSVIGLDISKWAVQAAARLIPSARWVVGSNARLPVPEASIDRLLCLFGFPVYAEFARVLREQGLLLQVDAGPDHLRELREVIYPVLKPARVPPTVVPEGFVEQATESLRYQACVSDAALIADLLLMTPHMHRATPEGRARVLALSELAITVDVRLVAYRREVTIEIRT